MTLDGFNECAEVNGEMFVYRPFTRHDRKAIAQQLLALPGRMAEKLERQLVASRIVCSEWGCLVKDLSDDLYREVLEITFGVGRDEQEVQDETNLADGVYLEVRYPWLAKTSCKSCKHWWWNPLTGELARQEGDPLRRPEDQQLMCEVGRCPKGHWQNPIELSPKNRLAYEHWKTCSALPDDPIVNRNARIIQESTDRARADADAARRSGTGSRDSRQPGGDGFAGGRAAGGRSRDALIGT